MAALARLGSALFFVSFMMPAAQAASNCTVLGWNNLGMHCMDRDFSVFAILPPYNTINAQVILGIDGTATKLTNGYAVTYQAVADPAGSVNMTSRGKNNFWDFAPSIFGANLPVDVGLPVPGPNSYAMPGTNNTPQSMGLEAAWNWFVAYGIPIIPYDDSGKPNQYPMMRLVALNGLSQPLASNDVVLPVSDEMECKLCHLSGSGPAARPAAGWVNDPDPGRDYRLNVLRLHDERQWSNAPALYAAALASNSFNVAGLYATVKVDKHPFICASCHVSEALPLPPLLGINPLTAAMHGHHAVVMDPRNGQTLDADNNRTACYTCHPGSVTRCLRGAMGKAVNSADGSMAMQCQDCHGGMSAVGDPGRTGWFDEPNCQACHTGNALNNSGQIRYTSVFDAPGHPRVPATNQFATTPDVPLPGKSLFRFSTGHGGVKCAGCHGSTHAEFPSAFINDNVASVEHQGHPGVLAECDTCHGAQPSTTNGGPHGLHPLGQAWVVAGESAPHVSAYEAGSQQCQSCHGADYTGTVLSRAQKNRTIAAGNFGARSFWRGQQIGCYDCHNGPGDHDHAGPAAPVVNSVAVTTAANMPVSMLLTLAGATGVRTVSQPDYGTVALSNTTNGVYYPSPGFTGTDTFTFAASSGYRESNIATGTVTVTNAFSLGDGIPDWWRQSHFGCTTCAVASADADPDNDQFSNLREFGAGTDPNDGRSNLRIFALDVANTNADVGFVSLLGRHYALDRRDDLISGTWITVNTNVWGWTDSVTATDMTASQSQRFYRIRVAP